MNDDQKGPTRAASIDRSQINADPEQLGLGKVEVFQTIVALLPTVKYQEKLSTSDAAAQAMLMVLAAIRQTEIAFLPEAERRQWAHRAAAPTGQNAPQHLGPATDQGRRMTDDQARSAATQQVMRQTDRR